MRNEHQRAEAACREARLQMSQGKLVQPRRLLEAALKDDPNHLPTRFALVELAILESNTDRAVRESKRATSIAFLRSREAGLTRGEYTSHPAGLLLLRSLFVGGRAHLAAGDEREAINALATVLQEDPEDSLGAGTELIGIFLAQGRPEGVLGLYRLGYAHGLNRVDVVLSALAVGAIELALTALFETLESNPEAQVALFSLVEPEADEAADRVAREYLSRRRDFWLRMSHVRRLLRRILGHPIVARTIELVDQLDEAETGGPESELAETRGQMFENLRSAPVIQTNLEALATDD